MNRAAIITIIPAMLLFYSNTVEGGEETAFLQQYGYLDNTPGAMTSSQALSDAVATYQRRFHLQVTGTLDEATKALMKKPRCGVSDHVRRRKRMSPRIWSSNELTYRIATSSNDIPLSEVRRIIRQAFDTWESVSRLRFREVTSGGTIVISFSEMLTHGDCPHRFGRDTLAHAFPPSDDPKRGDVHFNDRFKFVANRMASKADDKSLLAIAVHEIGHSLGLNHNENDEESVMSAVDRDDQLWKVSENDRKDLINSYGDMPTGDSEASAPIVFFEDEYQRGENIRYTGGSSRRCATLDKVWFDRTSSVNTGGTCIFVCSLQDCQGRCVKLAPDCATCGCDNHGSLSSCGIDNDIRSFMKC